MEEQALVRFLKNKSCSVQGATRAEATKYIHDILRVRDHLDKQCKGGWGYRLISDNGEKFLAKGKLSKSFWQRFENDYPSLARKRQGHHSAKRVFACTEAMVRQYLDDLAEELIWTGILTNPNGEILMCHVIFPGTCINGHMAPKTAVEKINNLLVSTTDSGY